MNRDIPTYKIKLQDRIDLQYAQYMAMPLAQLLEVYDKETSDYDPGYAILKAVGDRLRSFI
jgi:hypothetical protein